MAPVQLGSIRNFNRRAQALVTALTFLYFGPSMAATCTSKGVRLEAGTFCMTLNAHSGVAELRYGKASVPISIDPIHTNQAAAGFVSSLTAASNGSDGQTLTFAYPRGAGSTMTVTPHKRFLDFELTGTSGSPGDIELFNAVFPYHKSQFNSVLAANGGMVNFVQLPNNFYMGIVPANPQTKVWTAVNGSISVTAMSPASLPPVSATGYARGQRFAVFIAQASDLASTLADIDALYDIPVGVKMKLRPESGWDYLFLTDATGATSEDIIELAKSMGFKNILLLIDVWCDWANPSTPWLLKPGAKKLVEDLHAAGFLVGAHSFVHQLPAEGYYAKTHPDWVTKTQGEVGRLYKYDTPLLAEAAADYAKAIATLNADWVYFDGAESLWDDKGKTSEALNWYLRPLISKAMLSQLKAAGKEPLIVQQSSTWIDSYPWYTRFGQLDYWDNKTTSPAKIINSIAARAPTAILAQAFLKPDLGWFASCIHTPSGCRAPTEDEWALMTETSVKYNVPIGIEADYQFLANSPIKSKIVQLVSHAIAARGATPK
jgi:hypothetical protein